MIGPNHQDHAVGNHLDQLVVRHQPDRRRVDDGKVELLSNLRTTKGQALGTEQFHWIACRPAGWQEVETWGDLAHADDGLLQRALAIQDLRKAWGNRQSQPCM